MTLELAVNFLKDLRPGGPWTLGAGLDVATFQSYELDAVRVWLRRRKSRRPFVLLPETRTALSRPVLAEDVAHTRFVAVAAPGDKTLTLRRLAALPTATAALSHLGGVTAVWRLSRPTDVAAAAAVAERYAAVLEGSPTAVAPVRGMSKTTLVHLYKPVSYALRELSRHDAAPALALIERAPTPAQAANGLAGFTFAASVKPSPTDWLWPEVIPAGCLTLLSGQPKMGKSQIAIFMAAVVSSGGAWPTGQRCKAGGVILMEAEDSAKDIQARLTAAGADLNRVVIRSREDGPMDLSAPGNVALIDAAAKALGGVRLVVVSPGLAHYGKTGANQDAAVRAKLAPLNAWLAQTGAAGLLLTHPNKAAGDDLDAQFAGADTYRRAARAAYVVLPDAGDDAPDVKRKRRVMVCAGSNLGSDDVRMFYRIEGVSLDGGVQTSRVKWEKPQNPVTEQEIGKPRRVRKKA